MDRSERFIRIIQLLQSGTPVATERFLEDLEISLATFKRDLQYMRDRLNAPIEWDSFERGYRLTRSAEGPQFALPGLWLNASEIHALLMMQQLLCQAAAGWQLLWQACTASCAAQCTFCWHRHQQATRQSSLQALP